ncbi:hypothetical protein C5167_018974, partial [Papaver somniferum]
IHNFVYASDQTHCALQKAAQIAGINPKNFRAIATSKATNFGLSPNSLQSTILADIESGLVPLFLCATVGTTSSTAVDPSGPLCEVAKMYGIWVHVDAAYAGSACICPEVRHFIDGVEEADSFSLNAHKWFFTTLDCCCLWVKDSSSLVKALSTNPEYLKNKATESKQVIDYKDWQVALSRRFRSMKLWLVLRSYGVANLRTFLRSHVKMAKHFQGLIAMENRFEIVVPRTFTMVCFRLKPTSIFKQTIAKNEYIEAQTNEINAKLLESINASGRIYMTHAVVGGETQSFSFTWRGSSSSFDDHNNYQKSDGVAKFSMELPNDPKGIESVETAQQRLASRPNSCWQNAYENLFATCSVILKDDGKRSRLAWQLSDCFQKDSGRPSFPSCDSRSDMLKCLTKLDESAHKIYLEFYLQINSICHQLQANAFKIETERLVNDLKKSAEFAEEKLHSIQEHSERLIQNSEQIENSLTSLDSKTQQVAETSEKVRDQIDVSLERSSVILEQSRLIAASQSELRQGQSDMREVLEGGMEILHESYEKLGQNVEKLRNEAVEIEKEIQRVSNSMSTKMENLQNKANDIGNVAGLSLDKQKQLLDGQSTALEGLDFLTKFQSQALEESRASLQTLAEFGQKQQEELLRRQLQLQQAHDHLIENSKSILAAQEEFESKQASMFLALDKLFTLHNAILLESRSIKAFLFYSFVIFLLYMLTSAKQTYGTRARLYLGLCAIFLVEFIMCRFGVDLDQQGLRSAEPSDVRDSDRQS